MARNIKKFGIGALISAFALAVFCLAPVKAYAGDTIVAGYEDQDVLAINNIITNNGLSALPNDPAGWASAGIVTWDGATPPTPQRITILSLNSSGLTGSMDVSGLTALEELYCNNNSLTDINVSGLNNLTIMDCGHNSLTALDVSTLPTLGYLYCDNNNLSTLDVSAQSQLVWLDCSTNGLTSLNVAGLSMLQELDCYENSLTALDVSGLSSLDTLYCSNNNLTSLDASGLTTLRILGCEYNNLTSLNVSGLTALEHLWCNYNNLSSLDVSGLSSLWDMDCSYNNLTSLNVTGTNLTDLFCNFNRLTFLDLSSVPDLQYFDCSYNLMPQTEGAGVDLGLNVWFDGWGESFVYLPQRSLLTVTLNQATGGTATAVPLGALPSDSIQLNISALATGYTFVRWETSVEVSWISGSATSANSTFMMPEVDVTVTPVYQYDGTTITTPPTGDSPLVWLAGMAALALGSAIWLAGKKRVKTH
ncbi:MAG: hypothetical protein FWC59_00100 [Actinomycetia bacterium]|nr:hypothetical protein [Actinomycetes bacterium]